MGDEEKIGPGGAYKASLIWADKAGRVLDVE
jgi:hypothetical protein